VWKILGSSMPMQYNTLNPVHLLVTEETKNVIPPKKYEKNPRIKQ
jgi:hypothetical protein